MRRFELLEQRLAMTAEMLVDFNVSELGLRPSSLTSFNDELYFASNIRAGELWKSDGTLEGTVRTTELGAGAHRARPGEIIRINVRGDELVALVRQPSSRGDVDSLFLTDGTQDEAVQVASDIFHELGLTFADGSHLVSNEGLTSFAQIVDPMLEELTYYTNDSNGTRRGPTLPNRCLNGYGGCDFSDVTIYKDRVFFFTREWDDVENETMSFVLSAHHPGSETLQRIRRVVFSMPFSAGQLPSDFTIVDDLLYFRTNHDDRRLWVSDGTSSGTRVVSESIVSTGIAEIEGQLLVTGSETGTEQHGVWAVRPEQPPVALVRSDGPLEIYTGSQDAFVVQSDTGQVWHSDGTPEGSAAVGLIPLGYKNVSVHDEALFFTASSDNGSNLYAIGSDGTVIELGFAGIDPLEFTTVGEQLFFTSIKRGIERELWVYDGETVKLLDMPGKTGPISVALQVPVLRDGVPSGEAIFPVNRNSESPYRGESGLLLAGNLLYSDGTSIGTFALPDTSFLHDWGIFIRTNTRFFFYDGSSVWELDLSGAVPPTPTSPTEISAADPRYTYDAERSRFLFEGEPLVYSLGVSFQTAVIGAHTYFVNETEEFGEELWVRTSDNPEGSLVRDIAIGPEGSHLRLLLVSDKILYFLADDGIHGLELWSVSPSDSPSFLQGDIDSDGEVSFQDFLILSQNFGAAVEPFQDGDLDGDQQVNFKDFLLLSANFGRKL